MVPHLGRVVEHGTNGGRLDDIFQRLALDGRVLGNKLVQIVHIRLMVLAVVILKGLLRDVRLERVQSVGQRR